MRLFIFILIISLSSCVSTESKCKKMPWWKKQPNSYFKEDQKQNKKKYKSHRRKESKNHKCKR